MIALFFRSPTVTRGFSAFSLVFILIACQPAPATEFIRPTQIALASETPLPVPTATLSPLPTPVLTPTISPAELKRRVGPICENAFSVAVVPGRLTPPFAVMKKMTYADTPSWELSHQLPHLGSLSAADVRTVFCISETRAQAGTYTDGSAAYQLFWEVRAISWPGGKVIGKSSFTGSPPQTTKVPSPDSAAGSFPYAAFAAWIFNRVEHPDFLFFADAITTIAVSPNKDMVVFGSSMANQIVDKDYPAKIFLFKASDMEIISGLEGHQGMITSLAFSPDGEMLASSGYDLFVKFWEVASGHLLGQVNMGDTPNSLMFSPDGMKLVVASNLGVAFIDVLSMQIEHSIQEASGKDLAYSPDGDHVYVNSLGRIKVIDSDANMVTLTFPDLFTLVPTLSLSADGSIAGVTYETPENVEGFALSPDGALIVSYTIDRSLGSSTGAENVRLATWDSQTGKYMGEIKFSSGLVQNIKFSPHGNQLATSNGNEVWLWDTVTWQVKKKFVGHVGDIVDLAFTLDGTKILSAGSDGTIRVWSLEQ